MPFGRIDKRKAVSQSPPRKGMGVSLVVFLGCLLVVPSAIAALPEVPQVALPPPEVPKVAVPQLPPSPVQVPAPSTSKPEVKVPDAVAPAPSAPAPIGSGSAPDVSSTGGGSLPEARAVVSGATHSVGAVTSRLAEAPAPEASSMRERSGANAVSSSGRGAERRVSGGAPSVRVGVGAPLRRLLAYVWPAIALGPIGEVLAMSLGLPPASLNRLAPGPLADLARALSVLPDDVESNAGAQPASNSPRPTVSHPIPFSLTPEGGGMSLLATLVTVLAALLGVVALARLTVGEDLFSTRWLR